MPVADAAAHLLRGHADVISISASPFSVTSGIFVDAVLTISEYHSVAQFQTTIQSISFLTSFQIL